MPALFASAHALAFARDPGEDRLALLPREDGLVVVVVDGAGGLSGGALAAEIVVRRVEDASSAPVFDLFRTATWVDFLARMDLDLERDSLAGETTAVVIAISANGSMAGASVGDSGAWVVRSGSIDDLTAGQHRKLRLGSGRARPVPFSRPSLDGTLLVGTDGLFNHARPEQIAAVARRDDLDEAARDVIQLVRLPSGGLQDDVGVVLVRAVMRGSAPG